MPQGRTTASRKSTADTIRDRLDALIEEGRSIVSEVSDKQAHINNLIAHPESIPETRYQRWYTEAAQVIKRLAPDRVSEFRALYDPIEGSTEDPGSIFEYGIRHYLFGVTPHTRPFITTRGYRYNLSTIIRRSLTMQVSILEAMLSPLESVLSDIRGVIQADLFDSELESARYLHQNGYIRASGVVAGVILESHLQAVCATHSVTYQKQKPTINDLLGYLRSSHIIDLPVERRVQALSDIRNLCGHKRSREPTAPEVEQLLDGVDNAIKTIH